MATWIVVLAAIGIAALVAGLAWASLNDRFVKLEKEMDQLRTELLFLRGELDLSRREQP
jgi:type II secretory pathway pseudopilin PulG